MVALTGNQAVAQVQQRLGWRSDKSGEILVALQMAQDEMETGTSLPWFLKHEEEELLVTAGDRTLALPTGFKRIEDGPHYLSTAEDPVYLTQGEYWELYSSYAASDPGAPVAFTLRKSDLYLFPEPSEDKTLYWTYWAADDAITGGSTNQWLTHFPWLLIGRTIMDMAAALHNAEAAKAGAAMYSLWLPKVLGEDIEREAENRPYVMGGAT